MTLSEISNYNENLVDTIQSLPGVIKFEYNPDKSFLHATVDRESCLPFSVVKRIEDLGIGADGLFIYLPKSFGVDYTQHLRYDAKMKAFLHSNGHEVDIAKN